ncbi:MAG: FeoA family protein [Thermoplasmata archaeon]
MRLKVGDKGIIIGLEGGRSFQRRLRTMGIREGKTVKLITKHPIGGPLVIEIAGRSTTIGRGMAERILVRKVP